MAEQEQKKLNFAFKEIKKWKTSENKEQYLVLSLMTNKDTGKKAFLFNKTWKTKDGENARGKGVTIPVANASEVADSLKIASATEV